MVFPDDAVMWTLDTLCRAREFHAVPETGRMVVVLPWGELREVEPDHWDAILERGWVAVTDCDERTGEGGRVDVTEQGEYAIRRWAEWKERGAKKKRGVA